MYIRRNGTRPRGWFFLRFIVFKIKFERDALC